MPNIDPEHPKLRDIRNYLPDIANRFSYHPPKTDGTKNAHEWVRATLMSVAADFDFELPAGREKSLAITKLEEAMFWANAAIARNQKD